MKIHFVTISAKFYLYCGCLNPRSETLISTLSSLRFRLTELLASYRSRNNSVIAPLLLLGDVPVMFMIGLANTISVLYWGRHLFQFHGDRTFKSSRCFYSTGTQTVGSLFFHLGGCQPLHNALSLIFQSLTEDPTASFMTSSLRVRLEASLSAFLFPKSSCHFMLCSLMPSTNSLPASPLAPLALT